MKFTTFEAVRKAAHQFAAVTETGSRNETEKAASLLADWVKSKSWKRHDNSNVIVYLRNENLGTKNYPWIYADVDWKVFVSAPRETDKSFIFHDGKRVDKSKVIGWLSK